MPLQFTATNGRLRRRTAGVNQPGDHFLADTGLAEDQDLGLGSRGAFDLQAQRRHRRALAYQYRLLQRALSVSRHDALPPPHGNFATEVRRRLSSRRGAESPASTGMIGTRAAGRECRNSERARIDCPVREAVQRECEPG
jgi:hypothetical protein